MCILYTTIESNIVVAGLGLEFLLVAHCPITPGKADPACWGWKSWLVTIWLVGKLAPTMAGPVTNPTHHSAGLGVLTIAAKRVLDTHPHGLPHVIATIARHVSPNNVEIKDETEGAWECTERPASYSTVLS